MDESRVSRRKRARVDYVELECGADLGHASFSTQDSEADPTTSVVTSKWVKELQERTFADSATVVQYFESGEALSLDWARRTGLCRPTVVKDSRGLGLVVPKSAHFDVKDVARIVGEKTPVQVMRVSDQSEVSGWCLGDWSSYWYSPKRREALNVISLEFSKTKLAQRIKSPQFVREVDWIDTAWPKQLRDRGEYPQTQYYCLMSTAGCYTDFHVDFGGTAVWYHVLRGQKVFLLAAPTQSRLDAYEQWICDAAQDETFFADLIEEDAVAKLTLHAGQTLVIPSAWLHAVYTPVDSLVFGGNFLPGLCAARHQLAVHSLEQRARVNQKFRFPFFTSAMFFGLAATLRRLEAEDGKLTASEKDGISALLDACDIWAAGGLSERAKQHAALAAAIAGLPHPKQLVEALRTKVKQPKLKFTFHNQTLAQTHLATQDQAHEEKKKTLVKIPTAWVEQPEPPPAPPSRLDPRAAPLPTIKRRPATSVVKPASTSISRLKAKLAKFKK